MTWQQLSLVNLLLVWVPRHPGIVCARKGHQMYKTKKQFGPQNCQMGLKIVKSKASCFDLTCCSEYCNETKIRKNFSPEFCAFPSQYPAYVGFFGISSLKLSPERNPGSLAQCPISCPISFLPFLQSFDNCFYLCCHAEAFGQVWWFVAEKYLEVIIEFHLSMLFPPLLPTKAYNWFSTSFSGDTESRAEERPMNVCYLWFS